LRRREVSAHRKLMEGKWLGALRATPFLALVLLCLPQAAFAQTCNVPVPYPTVHAAVSNPACSVVAVAAGVRPGNVTVKRTLTIQGDGPGSTILAGAVLVSGPGTELILSSLSIDTTGPLAGCYAAALAVIDGAVVYPAAIVVSNAPGVPTVPCPIFADSFESFD
jgi:hypothetical protein